MEKILWFDMDGTVYPLYSLPDWLPRLRAEDWTVYCEPISRKGLDRIRQMVEDLRAAGWKIGIATWLSMGLVVEDEKGVNASQSKYKWAQRHFPELLSDNLFFPMAYGQSKAQTIQQEFPFAVHVLVDDNPDVLKDWRATFGRGTTVNAKRALPCQLERIWYRYVS